MADQTILIRKLHDARQRILLKNGFYGLVLMKTNFYLDPECDCIAAVVKGVVFNPDFLARVSDDELDFRLMHVTLHIALLHVIRSEGRDILFDEAADIVVNSTVMQSCGIDHFVLTRDDGSMYEAPHLAPNGREGLYYSADQIYDMLLQTQAKTPAQPSTSDVSGGSANESGDNTTSKTLNSCDSSNNAKDGKALLCDDHSGWGDDTHTSQKEIAKMLLDTNESIKSLGSHSMGLTPLGVQRIVDELTHPTTDWRTLLNEFVQYDVFDYSFNPPDKRFQDSDVLLPDYNDTEAVVKNVLIMIDTSASMSDDMIRDALSEIKAAIEQFGGKIQGWLGFFDAAVIEPKPFEGIDEFLDIEPAGGGGTDFSVIFEYVNQHMQDNLPEGIIVISDGYCFYPPEEVAQDIPVLWVLNNNDSEDPPWGKLARVLSSDN